MIKPRAILTASAALIMLFSPSIFAESYKLCRYTLVEWVEEDDGRWVNTIPFYTYSTRRVGVNNVCPAPPLPDANHKFVPLTEVEPTNPDISYLSTHTEDMETCEVHRKSLIIQTVYQ